jgi:hypothetical protein
MGSSVWEKYEKISQNPSLSIINQLFIESVWLFKFIVGIKKIQQNRSDISMKFFISISFFQFQPGSSVTNYRFFVTNYRFFPFIDGEKTHNCFGHFNISK